MSSVFQKFFRTFRSSLRFRLAGLLFAGVANFVEHHAADDADADGGPCADEEDENRLDPGGEVRPAVPEGRTSPSGPRR